MSFIIVINKLTYNFTVSDQVPIENIYKKKQDKNYKPIANISWIQNV